MWDVDVYFDLFVLSSTYANLRIEIWTWTFRGQLGKYIGQILLDTGAMGCAYIHVTCSHLLGVPIPDTRPNGNPIRVAENRTMKPSLHVDILVQLHGYDDHLSSQLFGHSRWL